MPFEDRDRVVGEFRRGETKILISTDVLSRGFDVSQVRPAQDLFDLMIRSFTHDWHFMYTTNHLRTLAAANGTAAATAAVAARWQASSPEASTSAR
jgi:hypothetical protein